MFIVRLIFFMGVALLVGGACLLTIRIKYGRQLSRRRQNRTTNRPLSEVLSMEARLCSRGEPQVVLKAGQPYLLLSREQVRDLYQMISQTRKQLALLLQASSPAPPDERPDSYDQAETQLHTKAHFIARSPQLRYPAIVRLEGLISHLSEDELTVLSSEIMTVVYDIAKAEASWWYAELPSLEGTRHLVRAEQRHRHGPALCGQLPPQDQGALFLGWLLVPVEGSPNPEAICPTCRALWQESESAERAYVPSGLEARMATAQDPWYDV
jgi:hypothetical protein